MAGHMPVAMLVVVLVTAIVASSMIGAVPARERFTNQTSMINNGGARMNRGRGIPRMKPTPFPIVTRRS